MPFEFCEATRTYKQLELLGLGVHLGDERASPREVGGHNCVAASSYAIAVSGIGEKTTLGSSLGLPSGILVGSAGVHGSVGIVPLGATLLVERKANQVLLGLDILAEGIPGSLETAHISAVRLNEDVVDVRVHSREEIGVAILVGVVDEDLASARLGAQRLGKLAEDSLYLLELRRAEATLDINVKAVQVVGGNIGGNKVLGKRCVARGIVGVGRVGQQVDVDGADDLCAAASQCGNVRALERGEVLGRLVALGENKRNVYTVGKIGQSILVDRLVAGNVAPGAEVGRGDLVIALLVVEDLLECIARSVGVARRTDGGG